MNFHGLSPPALDQMTTAGINLLSFQPIPPTKDDNFLHSGSHPGQEDMLTSGINLASTVSLANSITSAMGAPSNTPARTKKSRKRKSTLPEDITITLEELNKGGNKNVRDFVLQLLEHSCETFQDKDFGERALMNLCRKISHSHTLMNIWERAIVERNPNTDCVCISRPKDGRMTVAKSNVASTKKVFPQIVLCQVFRWPHIVFHNDIKSSQNCKTPSPVKPLVDAPAYDANAGEQICINPYHYEMSAEANARFTKAANRSTSTLKFTAAAVSETSEPKKKKSPRKGINKSGGHQTSKTDRESFDEGFGDEGENRTFDNQGVDYIKLWQDGAKWENRSNDSGLVESFDPAEIIKEIKFLTLETGQECSEKLKLKLKFREELDILLKGEYLQHEKKLVKETVVSEKELASACKEQDTQQFKLGEITISPVLPNNSLSLTDVEDLDNSDLDNIELLNEDASDKELSSSNPIETEDSAIQDLLDDIRGSFERQFDDEFEDLTAEDLARETAPIVFSLEQSFPMESLDGLTTSSHLRSQNEQPLQIIATPQHLHDANEHPEMPCILESWTVQGASTDAGEGNSFLSAGSISQEEFDNFFPGAHQQIQMPIQQQMAMYNYNVVQQPQQYQSYQDGQSYYHNPNQ